MIARALRREERPPSAALRSSEESTLSGRHRACAEALAELLLWYARRPRPSNESKPQE